MPTEYFEQRERALLGQRYEQLYAAPQQTAERGVTVSALRTTPEQFAQRADFPLEPSPFCKAAFVVHQPDFKPGRHPYHHAGVFYSQEPSASSAAPLLGVQPGMRVLDLCAAPGGKSSQLAAALQGRGVLVSNEYVAARAEILKSNLERMGVSNAVVLNETPARIAEALPEFFDRVLVDAPCSGEGMFRKEPVALQQHCEALVKQCAELGAQILDCAAAALAPGGQLVYSTCTFAPEEDEGQVAAFLQRHPEFVLADVLGNVDYTFGSAGEENRTGGLPLDVSKVRRIWPCQGGEGHFMARLVKAGTPRTLPPEGEYTPEEQLWLAAAAEAGKKGKGKTKELLDKVNSSIKGNEGSIVFLDKSQKHMYELNNQFRLINVMDYPIDNCDEFLGFICGIISQDHDLEEMYLDSFLTIASLDDEGDITKAIEKLDIISEKFKVKFILSVSRNIDKLPECAKAKVIISL